MTAKMSPIVAKKAIARLDVDRAKQKKREEVVNNVLKEAEATAKQTAVGQRPQSAFLQSELAQLAAQKSALQRTLTEAKLRHKEEDSSLAERAPLTLSLRMAAQKRPKGDAERKVTLRLVLGEAPREGADHQSSSPRRLSPLSRSAPAGEASFASPGGRGADTPLAGHSRPATADYSSLVVRTRPSTASQSVHTPSPSRPSSASPLSMPTQQLSSSAITWWCEAGERASRSASRPRIGPSARCNGSSSAADAPTSRA